MPNQTYLALSLALSSLTCALTAQGGWTLLSPATSPVVASSFNSPTMAFDAARGKSVMTVVMGNSQNVMEVWEWDGINWTRAVLTTLPTQRAGHAFAYGTSRNRSVMTQGWVPSSSSYRIETWEWNGTDWLLRQPANTPSARSDAAMAASPSGGLVLFGGLNGNTSLGDTWEWDGNEWRFINPVVSPGVRRNHGMAFDTLRNRTVLFGGTDGTALDDTWEWDGTSWIYRQPLTKPPARQGHAMAYDPNTAKCYIFGGRSAQNVLLNDLWSYDGTNWALASNVGPAPRFEATMCYDTVRNRLVLFGGSNNNVLRDTWEFVPPPAGSYTSFGTGCAGTRGAPFLSTQNSAVPVAGQSFTVQINNLPLTGLAWMAMGTSNTTYGSLPLPLDLSLIGMTGCTLYTSLEALFPVQNVLGVALWTVNLPAAVAGSTFYNQGVVADPTANSLGLITSSAATAVVGG